MTGDTDKRWSRALPNSGRVTLVLFRRRALGEQSGAEPKVGARVRKSRQKEAAGAADAGLMQIEWSKGEVLKRAGVGTEEEEGAHERVGARIDGRRRCEGGGEVGIGSGAGGRRRSAVNRAEFSSCGRAVSCGSIDQQWWRTELDLSSSKSFDDHHWAATLGATPKRVRFLGGGGFWFDRRRNCAQCCEAKRQ